MTVKMCLGIHYSTGQVSSVLLGKEEAGYKVLSTVHITREESDSSSDGEDQSLVQQIRGRLSLSGDKQVPVVLSLDGELYQIQTHTSQFSDKKQIEQTLRYDIEEDFAVDADLIALCYQQQAITSGGTDLLVYTAKRETLRPILDECERYNMDALVAEPDLASWCHYLLLQETLPDGEPVLCVAWTGTSLYMLILDEQRKPAMARSLPCQNLSQAIALLAREIPRSLALLENTQKPTRLYYHTAGLERDEMAVLAGKLQLELRSLQVPEPAIAWAIGAAANWLANGEKVDFRADFYPPRTVTRARNNVLIGLAAALAIFFVGWIIVMNVYSNNYRAIETRAFARLTDAYKIANPAKRLPRDRRTIPKALRRQLADLKARYNLQAQSKNKPDSAGQMCMLLFQALKELPEDFDLKIDNLSFDADSARFSGSVAPLRDLEQLRNVIEKSDPRLTIENFKFSPGGSSRDNPSSRRIFNMVIKLQSDNPARQGPVRQRKR